MQYLNCSFRNAVQCNSIDYCIQNVWSKIIKAVGSDPDVFYAYDADAFPFCEICQSVVDVYRALMTGTTSSQPSSNDIMQRCDNILNEEMNEFCKNVIPQWQQLIASQLNAPFICYITQYCRPLIDYYRR